MTGPLPPTEGEHPRGADLDLRSTPELVDLLLADQLEALDAVRTQAAALSRAVDEIAARLRSGGRLHYVGAGSSGRIATLDASEMAPTFGVGSDLVQAHVAGGSAALSEAVERAEDDAAAGDAAIGACVTERDAVVGISASGGAPFVLAALARAARAGAFTVALTSAAESPLARGAQLAIVTPTGPELLTGSTRLKAGTAQKIALNALSTGIMVRLGKVHGNFMVEVVATNEKLRARALRLVTQLAGVGEARARELLDGAGGRVKVAVVMERCGASAARAESLLHSHGGRLRGLL